MAVHLTPEEMAALPKVEVEIEEEEECESLVAELWQGAKPVWVWLGAACVVLIGGLNLMKKTLIAMDKLHKTGGGEHWQETWMPMAFFAMFGGLFGALLASRLSLSDVHIWISAAFFGAILAIVGGITAAFIFPSGIPFMCLVALGVIAVSSVVGAYIHTHWAS
jgi:hypothetical protein